jgi:diacylglycerol kinase family enzyme
MDAGLVNGKPFVNLAGVGFDAFVGLAFHRAGIRGGRRGILTYVRMCLSLLNRYEALPITLDVAGERIETRPLVLTFSNGLQFGAGAVLNPGAKLNDGRFEAVICEQGTFVENLVLAARLFLGGLEHAPRYRRIALEWGVLTAERPFPHHRDGEPEADATQLNVQLLPGALHILVPRATAEDPEGPFLPAGDAASSSE